jgi:hypothetical protein
MRHEWLRRSVRHGTVLALASGIAAAAPACNFLLGFDTSQCSRDSDCARFGEAYTCVSSTCVTTDASIADAGTKADAPAETGQQGCQSNLQCNTNRMNASEHFFCDKNPNSATRGQCVQIDYTDKAGVVVCFVPPYSKLYGSTANPDQLLDDNDILIGAFAPTGGNDPVVGPVQYTYELAQEELHAAGGIPGGTGSNGPRPLSIVYCNSDPAYVEEGVQHLVNTLHVPAILALFSDTSMPYFMGKYMVPNDVFTINAQETPFAMKNAAVNELLWNLLGTPDQLAPAFVDLMSKVETYARGRKMDAGSAPIRVALVTSASDCPLEFAIYNALSDPTTGLQFNGQNWQANLAAGNAKVIQTECPDTNQVTPGTYAPNVAEIVAFNPDVVIADTSQETGYIVPPVENTLYGEAGVTTLPIWILSTRNDQDVNVLAYLDTASNGESTTEKLTRFLGVQYADPADTSQVDAWMMRMQTQFAGTDPSTYAGRGNFYDAVFWLAYGYASAGPNAPVTGDSFKNGVRLLLSGQNVYPGDTLTISKAFTTIANSPTGTTYYGTLAQPNYPKPATGIPQSSGSVYCYNQVANAIVANYDELVIDPDAGVLEWNPNVTPCFSF